MLCLELLQAARCAATSGGVLVKLEVLVCRNPRCILVGAGILDITSSDIAVDLTRTAATHIGVLSDGREHASAADHTACLLLVLYELTVSRHGLRLVELHLEHGHQTRVRVHGCSSLVVGHVLLYDRIRDHIEVELGGADYVETTVVSGLDQLLFQIEDDLTKIVHAGGAGEVEVLEIIACYTRVSGNLRCVVGIRYCEKGFLCKEIKSLHCDERVLLSVVRDDGVNHLEVNLIGELHVTTVLIGLDLVLLNRALIGHGRYAFSQRGGVCLQGSPSTELKLVGLITDRLGICKTEIYVLVCIETDGVEQLLIVEHFGIDNTLACLSSKLNPGVNICSCVQKHGGISALRHRSTLLTNFYF